jgi:hypothetical protein
MKSVGHTNVSTAPDQSNWRIRIAQMAYKDDKDYSDVFSRNNNEFFVCAAWEIAKYLSSCLRKDLDEDLWGKLAILLRYGFATDEIDPDLLSGRWERVIRQDTGIDCIEQAKAKAERDGYRIFSYNKESMMSTLLPEHVYARGNNIRAVFRGLIGHPNHFALGRATPAFFNFNIIANEIREYVVGENYVNPDLTS